MRGEVYDERWKLRLVNRSQQNINLDETKPKSYYGNNVDDNYNNPR